MPVQPNIAPSAVGPLAAALAGSSAYAGGVPIAGMGLLASQGALAMPGTPQPTPVNKVMRELHVGGLPPGVSGQQLQVNFVGTPQCLEPFSPQFPGVFGSLILCFVLTHFRCVDVALSLLLPIALLFFFF